MGQEELSQVLFPMGNFHKSDIRRIARDLDLPVADKPDSQDICFVPNGDYASVIRKFNPKSFKSGNIIDLNNSIIGIHEGIINFTIGQRKGIRISDKEPLYVISINSKNNEIVVGPKSALGVKKIKLRNLNQLCKNFNDYRSNLYVKVRSTGKLLKAEVKINGDSGEVVLEDKEMGISPGQACVFYSKNKIGDKVLGGGWITKADANYLST